MRHPRPWTGVVLLLALASMLAVGAPPSAAQTDATPMPPATPTVDPAGGDIPVTRSDQPYRLALLVPFPNDPFWQRVQQAVTERAADSGVTVDVLALSAPSVPEQLGQIDQAIADGYDGILLGPVDAVGIAPGIVAANTAGIPVLAIDTAPIGGEVVSVVRTDNVAAARRAGQFIVSALEGEGAVLNIQGDLANVVAQERDQGLRQGLAMSSGITITSSAARWQRGGAYNATLAQLPQAEEGTPTPPEPLVDAVFAASPPMTLGAAQAVEDLKADTVIVVGFGATTETLDGIRNGTIEAVIAELPARVGDYAIELMVQHLNGDTVPAAVDSGTALVTRETVERVAPDLLPPAAS